MTPTGIAPAPVREEQLPLMTVSSAHPLQIPDIHRKRKEHLPFRKLAPVLGIAVTVGMAAAVPLSIVSGALLLSAELLLGGIAIYILWPKNQKNQ